jgi:hypothetical protein
LQYIVCCLVLLFMSGCASYGKIENLPVTESSGAQEYSLRSFTRADKNDDLDLLLTFSGGGTRAAATAYGVMQELRDTTISINGETRRLLDEVDTISSVSGGSFTSAYYGLNGDGIFDTFEDAFLRFDLDNRSDNYNDYWDDYHHDYWHDNDEWWALAAGLVIGAAIASPPPYHETVYVGTTSYYYANGSYYTPAPAGGYVVAAPPTGVTVEQPPDQIVNVTVNEQNYGYSNGAYYEVQEPETEDGQPTFKTVDAPVGAKVDYIPEGATSKTVDDVVYFVFNDVYYRPFYSGSEVVYVVAEKLEKVENPEDSP